jgi:YVTN family beta-propeller protein
MKKNLVIFGLILMVASACKKEDNGTGVDNYIESGSVFIVNEGGFTKNNGSISYITHSNKVVNNIFEQANGGQVTGDVLQSFSRVGNYGIICANNSQKVVVVDARTFKLLSTITDGTDYPRFSLGITSDKVYVTNGSFAGQVMVINLNTFTVTKKIPVGDGPEEMLLSNGKVYVANSGGFGIGNTISVINTSTDAEETRITVGDYPTEMEKDAQGFLWVLCKGYVTYDPPTYLPVRHSAAKLVRINPANNSIDKELEIIPSNADYSTADNLAMSGNGNLIFVCVDNKVYQMPISATSLPAAAIITRLFYGLDVHPFTGEIWGLDAGNFNEAGKIIRYNPSAQVIDSFKVGIIPNSVYFNL